MSDPYDLQRFVDAQDRGGTYDRALQELRDGRKTSHWMWFVFPQIAGLGRSPMAQRYAISSLDEARATGRGPGRDRRAGARPVLRRGRRRRDGRPPLRRYLVATRR